jgi:membrane protein DedA with SNARE-associated domain
MSVRKWHVGKLVILWAWGGIVAALVLTAFESSKVESSPGLHLCELIFVLVVALVLSAMTWIWLGDRKTESKSEEKVDP